MPRAMPRRGELCGRPPLFVVDLHSRLKEWADDLAENQGRNSIDSCNFSCRKTGSSLGEIQY